MRASGPDACVDPLDGRIRSALFMLLADAHAQSRRRGTIPLALRNSRREPSAIHGKSVKIRRVAACRERQMGGVGAEPNKGTNGLRTVRPANLRTFLHPKRGEYRSVRRMRTTRGRMIGRPRRSLGRQRVRKASGRKHGKPTHGRGRETQTETESVVVVAKTKWRRSELPGLWRRHLLQFNASPSRSTAAALCFFPFRPKTRLTM